MRHIDKSDELHIWKESRNLLNEVYFQLHENKAESGQFGKMVRRTAVSALCNVAEGYGSESRTAFRSFLAEAEGCCHEIRNFLENARRRQFLNEESFEKMGNICGEMMAGARQAIRRTDESEERCL